MRIGSVYKLVCNDLNAAECYVGSTVSVRNRKSKHKYNCNNVNATGYNLRLYQYIRENGGWENWVLIELEQIEYERKPELHARERYHMEILGATLNSRNPNRTGAEYYQDNINHIRQIHKQYYSNNKEKMDQKHNCECGGKYTHINKLAHLRTRRHCLYQLGLEQNV
jgi:hypothetical protein